ncbi:MAG TPA: class I SAM-dependent methyltransferase [Hanamia sp.]|nr:class I SAM-dependent methyltransferase [Hanamia sp.]
MMDEIDLHNNETLSAAAFTKQSVIFDELYSGNSIVQYKRKRVHEHLAKYLFPDQFILELNSGTGEDAIWLAQQNCRVHATDISTGMQEVIQQKINASGLNKLISYELCSFTELNNLHQKGPFDIIFSNFAGLNCTVDLDKVLSSFSVLLKPRGIVTLVILPKFCLWEFLLIFKGKFKTATRRFFNKNGRKANVEGHHFKCWYYNPSYIIKYLKKDFDLLSIEGLCTFVPPSYIENFTEKHPRIYDFLKVKENKWKSKWPWKYIGDYYIISLRKKD